MPKLILTSNDYPDAGALLRTLNYVQRSSIGGGYGVDPRYAYQQMMFVKNAYYKTEGVQLKHFVLSFSEKEQAVLDIDDLLRMGFETGRCMKEYQMVYNIHLDSDHIHLHGLMNTVSFLDGHKYCDGLVGFRTVCRHLESLYPGFHFEVRKGDPYYKGYMAKRTG